MVLKGLNLFYSELNMLFYYNFLLAEVFHIFDKNQKTSFSSLFPIPSENLNFLSDIGKEYIKANNKTKSDNSLINPLLHTNVCKYGQNFDFIIRRDNQKISYDCRVYESVDDTGPS